MTERHEDDSIAAYALGALDLETAERVHAHLAGCPRCRALTLRALHAACALPFSLPLYKVPADLKSRVLGAAQAGAGVQLSTEEPMVEKTAPPTESTAPNDRAPRLRQVGRPAVPVQIPWAAAGLGWIVAVIVLVYSHGLSDRVRVTRVNAAHTLAVLKRQLSGERTLRAFLTSPDLSITPLKNWVSATSSTRVELITRARSSQEIILAENLASPPSGELYVAWLKVENQRYQGIGTFTTNPRGEGLVVINAAFPLQGSSTLGISEEPAPAPVAPTTPLLFTVTLGGRAPVPIPTVTPAIAAAAARASERPTAGHRPTAPQPASSITVPGGSGRKRSAPVPSIEIPRMPGVLGA